MRLSEGRKIAVNLGVDFDAESLWLGAFNMPTPSIIAPRQFGAEVGVPRILELCTANFLRCWKDIFDCGYERVEGACFASAVHPQIIGQAHHMLAYERLIDHMAGKDGVLFATSAEIADCWKEEGEDRRRMPSRGRTLCRAAPVDLGWR